LAIERPKGKIEEKKMIKSYFFRLAAINDKPSKYSIVFIRPSNIVLQNDVTIVLLLYLNLQ
jgi:hypothetical protein